MLARINTPYLNVRSIPDLQGHVLTVVSEGEVLETTAANADWLQIQTPRGLGFIAGRYTRPVRDVQQLVGSVTASHLNVRSQPSTGADVLGVLAQGAQVKPLSLLDEWLEVEFNQDIGYVASRYIDLRWPGQMRNSVAQVTASRLNVRAGPDTKTEILGQLGSGVRIEVVRSQALWSQITYNGKPGFVSSTHLQFLDEVPPTENVPEELDDMVTELPSALPVTGSGESLAVAKTWNRFGAMLAPLSARKQLDVACSVAVLCVESSGKGFEQNNQGRMIIRFENHKFWRYWGKENPEQFRQHFRYSDTKVWQGHQWRAQQTAPWQEFHGAQSREWQVFEFARGLDERGAMLSISMGAPQIMGFHFERIGYQSVQEMFAAFSQGIEAQLTGLFDFFSEHMLGHLRNLEFEDFAAGYNGSGQARHYGNLIRNHYYAYKKLANRV